MSWINVRPRLRRLKVARAAGAPEEIAWDEHDLNQFLGRRGFTPAPRLVLELSLDREEPAENPPLE